MSREIFKNCHLILTAKIYINKIYYFYYKLYIYVSAEKNVFSKTKIYQRKHSKEDVFEFIFFENYSKYYLNMKRKKIFKYVYWNNAYVCQWILFLKIVF